MELLYENLINTTTQLTVSDNTATAGNILFRDERFVYATANFADDNTTASLTISFDETVTVDRVAMIGHNLKSFTMYYNGATANTFALTSTANTTASDYATNSATSQYFKFTPVDCTSVTLDMKTTISANENKVIAYLAVTESRTNFNGRVPSAQNYIPRINPTNVVHRLSDGGTRIQTLEDKYTVDMRLDFIDETTRDELKVIFDDHEPLIFQAFGTTTGWTPVIFPCVWEGAFTFYQYSENATQAGYTGNISLRETPQ